MLARDWFRSKRVTRVTVTSCIATASSSRLQENADDQTATDLAVVLFETATLRSGYQLVDTKAYGDRIERMLRLSMNVDLDEQASLTHTQTHTDRGYSSGYGVLDAMSTAYLSASLHKNA